jgi:large subunit ribosomal protein L23
VNIAESKLAEILMAPVISEKSTEAEENDNCFVFKVQKVATKKQIKNAVEVMFDVKVDSVRSLNVGGKTKRFGRTLGKRSDWKKAYIKLKEGYTIAFASA